MNPIAFNKFLSHMSKLPASLIAKNTTHPKSCFKIPDDMPIFDALELLEKHNCLVTESGFVITREDVMYIPTKTIFYSMIIEIEYRLYKVLKNRVKSLEELRNAEFNDLIRQFLADTDLFSMQNVYAKKQEMKDDLKAISSFRNVIMHSPKKIDLKERYDVVLKRKNQALKLLDALGQLYYK